MAELSPRQLARRRAKRGAKLLDEKGPLDWRQRLDPAALNVGSGSWCPVAQAYTPEAPENPYSYGLRQLGLETDYSLANVETYGFDWDHERGVSYELLNEAWLAILTEEAPDGDQH